MLWYIAIGSAIGGVSRYLVGGLVQRLAAGTFPAGTLLINVSGSFLLGAILRYGVETTTLTPEVRALLTVGFCGGYTTFRPSATKPSPCSRTANGPGGALRRSQPRPSLLYVLRFAAAS
jgi:protein CrcB